MQDRFKFRIFIKNEPNPKYNGMFKVHSLHLGTNKAIISSHYGNVSIKLDNNKALMQCTGLKDKNGKLIYEGDVVKDKCSEAVATIEYLPYTFSLMAHIRGMDDYLPLEDICYALEVATPFEVIGNIYENPELLEV